MIEEFEEFGRYVAIAGFGRAKIDNINAFFTLVRKKVAHGEVQFFDADLIASWEHLYFAVLNSLKAFESRLNISNSLAMETLLFASAQRQISKAIDLLGIKPESSRIAVIVIANTLKEANSALETISRLVTGERDDSVLELTEGKMEDVKRLFDISNLELTSKLGRAGLERDALVDLVIEHVALLATQR